MISRCVSTPASTVRCCSLYRSEVLMIQLFSGGAALVVGPSLNTGITHNRKYINQASAVSGHEND